MSTPATRKSRRKAWAVTAALVGAFGIFLIGANAASAAVTCVYDGTNGRLFVVKTTPAGGDDTVTFRKSGGSPGAILVNGATCVDPVLAAAATVNNVNSVYIDLPDGEDTVVIDNTNGRVTEPGVQDIPGPAEIGLNDIEWFLQDTEHFVYNDTEAAGAVTIGQADGTEAWDGSTDPIAQPITYRTWDDWDTVVSPGDNLINLNAFPADNDADVWDTDNDLEDITVNGNGGDDFILGKGGDGTGGPTDVPLTLNGGDGLDEIEGGLGDDTISGGPGKDVLDGNSNNPVVVDCFQDDATGEWSNDSSGGDTVDFSGEAGPLVVTLNEDGTMTITTNPDATVVDFENVIGSSGDDTITGNSLDNVLVGGPGNDKIDGKGGNDVVEGDAGDDTLAGGLDDDCVLGGSGNDILDENAPLKADGTPDYGVFGNGADALDGGDGLDDTVDYGHRTNRTIVFLGLISTANDGADPNANGASNECDDVFFSTENAITGSGNDILSADFLNNQADNEFTDGAGNDQIDGGAGNDISHQGSSPQGADAFEGESGADTMDYGSRSGDVTASLDGAGNDGEAGEGDNAGAFVFTSGNTDCSFGPFGEETNSEFTNEDEANDAGLTDNTGAVENLIGGSGNDNLTGNDDGNVLTGNAGNDRLSGEGGGDRLTGGDGNDVLIGGKGNDAMDAGAGTDWFDYQSAGAGGVGVQVNLATGSASGDGNDTLTGGENVGGSSFADVIRGDAGANVLNGRGGNDAIQGNGGDDVVNGGPGNDELNGNGGNDTVRGQSGNDTARGAGGNDVVKGDLGDDTVLGNGGNDKLYGGSGKDDLRGGPGSDQCRPGAPGLARGDHVAGCEA